MSFLILEFAYAWLCMTILLCENFIVHGNVCQCFYTQRNKQLALNAVLQDSTIVHYTGYKVCDLAALARQLNAMIQRTVGSSLKAVFTKYSHKYGVAIN